MTETENRWVKTARDQLQGRRIVYVRYMREDEADSLGWHTRPVVLVLDDGNLIYPASDDEGNDGGALYTNNEQNPVLPVI
jgi:hypothetical protein